MLAEAKPLFHPDVLRTHLATFALPPEVDEFRSKLARCAGLRRLSAWRGFDIASQNSESRTV